jgi:N-acetylneuraminic acid mutarotase
MINPHSWGSAAACNGKIYVVGGFTEINWGSREVAFCSTMEVYDPATDAWTEKECPYLGWLPVAAAVNGKFYVMGGFYGESDRNALKVVYEYDPVLDVWENKESLPTGRWGAVCVVLDDLIYVLAGGLDYTWSGFKTDDCNIVEVYDPSSDSWDTRSPVPVERTLGAACVLNGMIYYGGGAYEVSSAYDNFHVYDPACDAE